MKVSELGQFGLIDAVAEMVRQSRDEQAESWKNLLTGIGDDCAVWKGETVNQLAKVDCQVEGIHFNLDYVTWEEVGWKALAVNLSDIASMGGIPHYALVSMGLPLDTEVENVLSLYRGMLDLARRSGTAITGGNMSGSPVVFVDVNVIGRAGNAEGSYLERSAARPGDIIGVTGWLGSAAAGLRMLREGIKLEETAAQVLRQAFTRPEPRLEEGRLLLEKGVKAAIDISDGLVADLRHLCRASGVGAVVSIEHLPVRPEVEAAFGREALDMALSGGEDYQLLFTAPPDLFLEVRQASAYPVTAIGDIVAENAGQVMLINEEGKQITSSHTGWDHFKSRKAVD